MSLGAQLWRGDNLFWKEAPFQKPDFLFDDILQHTVSTHSFDSKVGYFNDYKSEHKVFGITL